ncbi:MAG: YbaK/EbsC family protein [Actinomycetes bacterium]
MRPHTAELAEFLTRESVEFELAPHRHTERARDAAAALGLSEDEVAKTIILTTGNGFVRCVIPASERLDLLKVRSLLDLPHDTRLATEDELVAAYPRFEIGAVPPIGGPHGDRLVVDRHVAGRESVVVESGSHDESVRLRTKDILITGIAEVGDICHD